VGDARFHNDKKEWLEIGMTGEIMLEERSGMGLCLLLAVEDAPYCLTTSQIHILWLIANRKAHLSNLSCFRLLTSFAFSSQQRLVLRSCMEA
jgi:hypothetical protein